MHVPHSYPFPVRCRAALAPEVCSSTKSTGCLHRCSPAFLRPTTPPCVHPASPATSPSSHALSHSFLHPRPSHLSSTSPAIIHPSSFLHPSTHLSIIGPPWQLSFLNSGLRAGLGAQKQCLGAQESRALSAGCGSWHTECLSAAPGQVLETQQPVGAPWPGHSRREGHAYCHQGRPHPEASLWKANSWLPLSIWDRDPGPRAWIFCQVPRATACLPHLPTTSLAWRPHRGTTREPGVCTEWDVHWRLCHPGAKTCIFLES